MRKEPLTCYMCDSKATSNEHAPPAMFFPEQKDLPKGLDYRKGLISVPSCDLHNSKKSKDDEFLCIIIVSHFKNNLPAQRHFSTKVMRALHKRRSLLALFKNPRPAFVEGKSTGIFNVDIDRFHRSLDHIARALYFDKYKKKWTEPIKILTRDFFPNSSKQLKSFEINQLAFFTLDKVFEILPKLGNNPEIFYYQIYCNEQLRQLLIKMVFYEGFAVIACSSPVGSTAFNL